MEQATSHSDTPNATATAPRRSGPHATSQPPSGVQRLLTIQQAVIEYGIPIGTLRDQVHGGHLRRVAMPDGKRWWFDRRDLDRFVDGNKVTGAA